MLKRAILLCGFGVLACGSMPPELLARGILQPAGDVYRCRARWH